jgi:hypothetical protein
VVVFVAELTVPWVVLVTVVVVAVGLGVCTVGSRVFVLTPTPTAPPRPMPPADAFVMQNVAAIAAANRSLRVIMMLLL